MLISLRCSRCYVVVDVVDDDEAMEYSGSLVLREVLFLPQYIGSTSQIWFSQVRSDAPRTSSDCDTDPDGGLMLLSRRGVLSKLSSITVLNSSMLFPQHPETRRPTIYSSVSLLRTDGYNNTIMASFTLRTSHTTPCQPRCHGTEPIEHHHAILHIHIVEVLIIQTS